VLVQLSQIVADHAEVTEIDINPLLCDAQGDRAQMLSIAKDLEFSVGPMPADAALLRAVKVL
jgi:hypothetical protein